MFAGWGRITGPCGVDFVGAFTRGIGAIGGSESTGTMGDVGTFGMEGALAIGGSSRTAADTTGAGGAPAGVDPWTRVAP